MRPSLFMPLISSALMTACGGGDGAGQESAPPRIVTEYYASGRPAATGTLSGAVRTGPWVEYHDADGSPRKWEGAYAHGIIDTSAFWCEWNADGSIRADQTDR